MGGRGLASISLYGAASKTMGAWTRLLLPAGLKVFGSSNSVLGERVDILKTELACQRGISERNGMS